jgi:hypothetical protein
MQDPVAPTPNHLRRSRLASGDSPSTFFFWLSVLGLGCLSLACVCWGASSLLAKKGSENLLRVGLHLPKLNLGKGERKADAFRTSEPAPNATAQPKERATPAGHVSPVADHPRVTIVETPHQAPVPTEEPPRLAADEPGPLMIAKLDVSAPIETCDDPLVYLEPCAPQRGDTPMIRNWKMLTLMSLLSAATISVMPQPILLAQAGEPAETEGLDKLQKTIEALDKKVDDLKKSALDKETAAAVIRAELEKLQDGMLKELKNEIAAIRADQKKQEMAIAENKALINLLSQKVNSLQGNSAPAVDKAYMDEMKKSMKDLQDAVAKLGPTGRISLSPPINGDGAPKVGSVKLVNNFSRELVFTINGRAYNVLPGDTLIVRGVPAGPMTYQVNDDFAIYERQVVNLIDGKTREVRAR